MQFRSWALIVIATGVLVAGCRGTGNVAKAPDAAAKSAVAQSDDSLPSPAGNESWAGNGSLQNAIDAHAHYAAGVVHEMNLEPEAALEEYYKAAVLDPTNESLVLDVSQQFLQAKQTEKALDLLTRSATNSTSSGAIWAELGFVYSKLGKTNEAINADRLAIKKDPQSLAGYQSLYLDYEQNKQTPQLMPLLDEAGKVKGTDAAFLIGLGELYLHLGAQTPSLKTNANARALGVFQRAAKMDMQEMRLRLRLGDGFNVLGKTEDAARLYESVVKDLPDTSPQYDSVHAKLADIYLHNHDSKRAAEQLDIIRRDNPTDPQPYYLLGSIAYDETNYTKAADYFRNAILVNPDYEPAYYNLATAQLGADKTTDALGTLESARRKFPQTFMGEYLFGMAYSRQRDYTNALQHLTTAEVLGKNSDGRQLTDGFYFELGAASERVGQYIQAEKAFENCLQIAPDFAEALNYLGYMWAEHDRKLDQARDLISKALKSEPQNAAYLDSMAWVLFKLHEPKPALDYALKALKYSEEEDATLYDHLGDIYAALGQKDKAQQAWKKSLSLEANDVVRKKMESK